MPTAVWTGSLSLGMVVVPVRLYPAIRKKSVRFHELDPSGHRVRHIRVSDVEIDSEDAATGPVNAKWADDDLALGPSMVGEAKSEVAYDEIQKGFEVAPGEYVSMSREEVAALAPERSRVIDVEQFVDVSAIDPIYFESRYYVVPDRKWSSTFRVLRQAMATADRMAIAWFTLRSRRYLTAIRPYGDVMLLTTMVHADEVLPADFLIDESGAITDKEIKMAGLLMDTLSGPFEPELYPDEHRQRLLQAIDTKIPIQAPLATQPPTSVLDLMAALEASVKAAKASRAAQDRQAKGSRRQSRGA